MFRRSLVRLRRAVKSPTSQELKAVRFAGPRERRSHHQPPGKRCQRQSPKPEQQRNFGMEFLVHNLPAKIPTQVMYSESSRAKRERRRDNRHISRRRVRTTLPSYQASSCMSQQRVSLLHEALVEGLNGGQGKNVDRRRCTSPLFRKVDKPATISVRKNWKKHHHRHLPQQGAQPPPSYVTPVTSSS